MQSLLKPALALFTLVAGIGFLVHDMHIDRMTIVAVGAPAAIATYGVIDNLLKKSDHTHVDRAAFPKQPSSMSRTPLPKMQPRDDGRRYIQNKKVLVTGGGEMNSLWPSV